MNFKRNTNKEILLKFKQTHNPRELDEMLYEFEKEMNENNDQYFLKESENPFIYFLEYGKPEELVKRLKLKNEYTAIPVTCVLSNMNYITATILRKIRHKICYQDTFKINCHINTFCIEQTKETLENELSDRIHNVTKIDRNVNNPVWTINVYIVGDITAINITNTKSNRISNRWT